MPLHPPAGESARRDPRLDPYRERAGHLYEGDVLAATVFLRVGTCWWQTGGHLWWRTWSEPKEQIHGFLVTPSDAFEDFVADVDDLDTDITQWDAGLFALRGEVLRVQWLDDATSQHVRSEVFGLEPPP